MIIKIEKINRYTTSVSKLGKKFKRKRTHTLYHLKCDICEIQFNRTKGNSYNIESRKIHVCSNKCLNKYNSDKWQTYTYKKSIRSSGYVYLGQEREHRIIAEKKLGRKLKKGETVHHIDGNKSNNNEENLYVCDSMRSHNKVHKQLEDIAFVLIQNGKIIFNHLTGRYELKE